MGVSLYSNISCDDEEKERFEEPGDIIDKRNIVLKISVGDSYNYQLELRNKGLVIKALDNSSVSFIESNKGLVIQSAISEVMSVVGFVKSQLKTIIIDTKKGSLASNKIVNDENNLEINEFEDDEGSDSEDESAKLKQKVYNRYSKKRDYSFFN